MKLRVAQWGTGNVGLRALAAVIEHPRMELVACRVYSEAKEGRDAGELCGKPAVGVKATRSLDAVIAARPDCVVYLPDQLEPEVIEALLGAGINVATALIGFNHRGSIAPDLRARLEAACARGGTSLYSTGSSPGWSTEMLPMTLLAMQRRFDSLTITDYADMASRDSPLMIFDGLGFGKNPADLPADRRLGTAASTPPTFHALADAIGLPLDEVTASVDYALTVRRETVAAGTIEAGTIGAMRMGVIGLRHGRPLLSRYSVWYLVRDLDQPWELRDSGWRMQVKGDTSLDVSVGFDVVQEDYAAYSPGLTAHPVINALPYVVAAPPGLLETRDLPQIIPYFS
jgi:4-hydroxy-tetrahydrodipicolinate reductase